MQKLKNIIYNEFASHPESCKRIGGGYYADVYKINFKNAEPIVAKVYKSSGIMQNEVAQIALLSKQCLVPMPQVLSVHNADAEYEKDFITMNYLEGGNGGNIFYLSLSKRQKLANQVIDNLIAFHSAECPDGFGEINSERRYDTWNEYYKEKVSAIIEMAKELKDKGELPVYAYDVMKKAATHFDRIFCFPITQANLIHGDYNMWNILADRKQCRVTAVIDPCGAMWADREYDLYQLNNANGKHLRLFETYASKQKLSENCYEKMAFYELFTEVEHYYKSGHPVVKRRIKKQADKLNYYLEKLL